MAERDPRAKNAKPEQFIDGTILREIEKSGFVLYQQKQSVLKVHSIVMDDAGEAVRIQPSATSGRLRPNPVACSNAWAICSTPKSSR